MRRPRPHVFGIDDGPFSKDQAGPVPIVGVMMEGATLVESVAVTAFPVDGDDATGFLADWVGGLRAHASLQALVLGGITIAGLGIVDLERLASRTGVPVLSATRAPPTNEPLLGALRAAGLDDRAAIVHCSPPAVRIDEGLYVASTGIAPDDAETMLRAIRDKARVPEPLRVAHLIAAAIATGASRGRA